MTGPPAILYEDGHCLAVAKPAGLLTQGTSAGGPTLELAVREHLAQGSTSAVYLGTVHRLDREVSGVVLWAKTLKASRRLSAQFAAREVFKEYWAVVEDRDPARGPGSWNGTWDDWLVGPDQTGRADVADEGTLGARRAVTRCRLAAAESLPSGTVWLRLNPETGRTHQLRVQAAHRGAPIVGDLRYGAVRPFAPGIALHARVLRLRHPVRRDELAIEAPVPESWAEAGIVLSAPGEFAES